VVAVLTLGTAVQLPFGKVGKHHRLGHQSRLRAAYAGDGHDLPVTEPAVRAITISGAVTGVYAAVIGWESITVASPSAPGWCGQLVVPRVSPRHPPGYFPSWSD
jgi:hypothetical protein